MPVPAGDKLMGAPIQKVLHGAAVLGFSAGMAMAQDGGAASLTTGVSYSSLNGGLAFIGVQADDLLGTGIDLSLDYQAGDDGEALNGFIAKSYGLGDTALGFDTFVRVGLGAQTANFDSRDFSIEHFSANVTMWATAANGLTYDAQLFWQSDTLADFDPSVSPLVANDTDGSTATGVSIGLGYSTFTDRGPLALGFDMGGTLTYATSLGDREWMAAEVGTRYNTALPYGLVLAMRADAGRIEGRGDSIVNIVDRAFIGSDAPRGFTDTGIGPRDFVDGSVNTALGGKTYWTASLEVHANRKSCRFVWRFCRCGVFVGS
ncbi:BamA/TamA family outer membrane protein (plasmid) [Octadecabacter sp. SW4]|nr:BamA/TamA family outer membrane protein [Octadecabacter sp. SW4]